MALQAPLLSRKRVVQVKVETTKGTEETTGLSDLLCFDPKLESAAEWIERKGTSKFLGHMTPGMFSEELGVFSCSAELRGNGSNAMDAAISALLQACGLVNTSETYTPTSTISSQKTATIRSYLDGTLKVLYGAAGTCKISGEWGQRVMLELEMAGMFKAPADAALPTYSPGTTTPPLMGSGAVTLASNAFKFNKFELDFANQVTYRPGADHYCIADRDPTFSFDPEWDKIAGYDFDGIRQALTTAALSLAIGSGAGKAITITAPKVQQKEPGKEGDREGIAIYEYMAQLLGNSGDDEYSIAVTTA